jgi:hypothetical protein
VAFSVWEVSAGAQSDGWVLDGGSTVHIARDKSNFVKYRKLEQPHMIAGIGGPALAVVGVGEVQLLCKVPEGIKPVQLIEVWRVPEARANLFSERRATDAGAEVHSRKGCSQISTGGKVDLQAVQRNGLLMIETVGRQKVFPAKQLTVRKSPAVGTNEGFKNGSSTKVSVFEIDLEDSDSESEENEVQTEQQTEVATMATEVVGAAKETEAREAQTPAAESVGAAGAKKNQAQTRAQSLTAGSVGATQGMGDDSIGAGQGAPRSRRYSERDRRETYGLSERESENVWVTPKTKKKTSNKTPAVR